ncbi:hypothetical protein PEC301879_39750 [Pectobacterium carotovorum subsp. carotovorum]|nr:hypothetical protein PEC301879_39750 [Pectobacterium carotovorum subsp. carotovorum]
MILGKKLTLAALSAAILCLPTSVQLILVPTDAERCYVSISPAKAFIALPEKRLRRPNVSSIRI